MELEDIVSKITEKTGLSSSDINNKIQNKQQELSGLVSKEGAAYIIAKEHGLDLLKRVQKKIQIKDIDTGMRSLTFKARVYRIFPTREFTFKGRKGRVANILLSDPTGTIRMSLWDSQIDILRDLKVNDPVEIFGAYTKQDNIGGVEVRIGKAGGIKVLKKTELPDLQEMPKRSERARIADMKEGQTYEMRAAVVQLFDSAVFFEVCPDCGRRVRKDENFNCTEHGNVQPNYSLVVSGVIDDGSENIRVVLFRENALKLIGMDINEALEKKSSLINDVDVLGKEFIFKGNIRRNKMFNRLEFVVNDLKEVDIKQEAENLIQELKT